MTRTITKYKELRRDKPFLSAANALRIAKAEEDTPDWLPYIEDGAKFEHEGFEFTIKIDYDDYAQFEDFGCGYFTDHWAPGAIVHTEHRGRGVRNAIKYFIPDITEEEHYQGLRLNHGKAEARELARQYVLEDYHRACDICEGIDGIYIVRVGAYKKGVELGNALIGGVNGIDQGHLSEVVVDLVDEALFQARETLKALREED